MENVSLCYPHGKTKALTFSYDDGVNFDKKMIAILNAHGMKGTFNLSAGAFYKPRVTDWVVGGQACFCHAADEVAQVYEGHEVASHGLTHPYWTNGPREQMLYEIWEDKKRLEQLVGYPIRGIAYPFSDYDADTQRIVQTLGFRFARTTGSEEYFKLPKDFLDWQPTRHHNAPDLMEHADRFLREDFNTTALFCLFGHSFEFPKDGNWQLLEDFCGHMAGRSEIWYAANGEIFDYLHAAGELVYFADGSKVYNPTVTDIYLRICQDKQAQVICVRGGQTAELPLRF